MNELTGYFFLNRFHRISFNIPLTNALVFCLINIKNLLCFWYDLLLKNKLIDANTHALARQFTLEDLLEVAGI